MIRTREEWERYLTVRGVFWFHDGNPKRPHALLTEGGHSSGFFNGGLIAFDDIRTANDMCSDLAELALPWIQSFGKSPIKIVGPEYGAVSIAVLLAVHLGLPYALVRPEGEGENKIVKMDKRFKLDGMKVLRVEDTITTGGTIKKTRPVCEERGGKMFEVICAWCNRSGKTMIDGGTICALIDKHMPVWDPQKGEPCPLCAQGSEAIRPKGDEGRNWKRLIAAY